MKCLHGSVKCKMWRTIQLLPKIGRSINFMSESLCAWGLLQECLPPEQLVSLVSHFLGKVRINLSEKMQALETKRCRIHDGQFVSINNHDYQKVYCYAQIRIFIFILCSIWWAETWNWTEQIRLTFLYL